MGCASRRPHEAAFPDVGSVDEMASPNTNRDSLEDLTTMPTSSAVLAFTEQADT